MAETTPEIATQLEIKDVTSPFKVYKEDEFWSNVEVLCPLNKYIKENRSKFT